MSDDFDISTIDRFRRSYRRAIARFEKGIDWRDEGARERWHFAAVSATWRTSRRSSGRVSMAEGLAWPPAPLPRHTWRIHAGCKPRAPLRRAALPSESASDEDFLDQAPYEAVPLDNTQRLFGLPRNFHDKYVLGKPLGAGSYGVVSEAIDKDTRDVFAVKSIPKKPKRGQLNTKYLLKLQNEIDIMKRLGVSLNIVYLYTAYEDDTHVHLLMEACTGGELWDRVKRGQYNEAEAAKLVRAMLRTVAQCHAKNVMYRDVKPDNFLFLNKTPSSPLKATDFGLATIYQEGVNYSQRCGTPAYMAPELILQNYGPKCDMWSVGMCAYQLLTGRLPFWDDVRGHTMKEVWKAVLYDDINLEPSSPIWQNISEGALDLVGKLLDRDPDTRLSAEEALAHPWVQDAGHASTLPLRGSVVQRIQRFGTFGLLKQTVLRMIADYIPETTEQMSALRALFEQMDYSRTGKLTLKELKAGLRIAGYELSDREVGQLMEQIDIDMNGEVDYSEFAAALVDWATLIESEDQWGSWLEQAFLKLDVDHCGGINVEDIVECLPSQLGGWRHAEAKRVLRQADRDGDGKISLPEFKLLLGDGYNELDMYEKRLRA